MHWVLTREHEDNERLLLRLERAGKRAASVPAIARKELPWPRWPAPEAGARVVYFVTSAYVAHRVSASAELVAAMSPSSAGALIAAGRPPDVTAEGGAIALAEATCAQLRGPLSVRYPTSDAGVASSEHGQAVQILQQRGDVCVAVVYETTVPLALELTLNRSMLGLFALFFASPSAVRHALPFTTRRPERVVCLGASTARAYKTLRPSNFPEPEHVNTEEQFLEIA